MPKPTLNIHTSVPLEYASTTFFLFFLASCFFPCLTYAADKNAMPSFEDNEIQERVVQEGKDRMLMTRPGGIFIGQDAQGNEVMSVTPPPSQYQEQPVIPYIIPEVQIPYPGISSQYQGRPWRPGRPGYPGQPGYPPPGWRPPAPYPPYPPPGGHWPGQRPPYPQPR